VVALAGVLLAYGSTELIEGYGFVAAFAAGVTVRRSESEHEFHRRLHDFSESLEHALTAILLVALGAAIPILLPHFALSHAVIGTVLVFVIRPLAAWTSLANTAMNGRARFVVAFYGVRGIGSVYYLAYAGHHIDLVDEYALWSVVALTVLLSTLVHGLTAGLAVERATGERERRNEDPASC
jgi:sodium/hydrogen antiporter